MAGHDKFFVKASEKSSSQQKWKYDRWNTKRIRPCKIDIIVKKIEEAHLCIELYIISNINIIIKCR